MAVSPEDFRAAKGQFLSLESLKTNSDGWTTAIAVTLEGIVGGDNVRHRCDRMQYRLLASVQDLKIGLPMLWVVSPSDQEIQHVNIWPAREICPFVGVKLPDLCWGASQSGWSVISPAEQTLANFLEDARQILGSANFSSRAR